MHLSDYVNNSNEFHAFQSHDDSHSHKSLNTLSSPDSDDLQSDQLSNDQGPKKIQIADYTLINISTTPYKSILYTDIQYFIHGRYLECDTPPPDHLT
jgi:hypothetical protein